MHGRRTSGHARPAAMLFVLVTLAVPALPAGLLEIDGSLAYEPHAPMRVVGDAGLASLDGLRGGRGTADDPYVIAGWQVLVGGEAAVRLEGTSAHVVVRDLVVVSHGLCAVDCWIPQGVELVGARNVTVERVRVYDGAFGIRVHASADVVVRDLVLGQDELPTVARIDTGILVTASERVLVDGIRVTSATWPFIVDGSRAVRVTRSTFLEAPGAAGIGASAEVSVDNSTFRGAGIALVGALVDVSISDNLLEGTIGIANGQGPGASFVRGGIERNTLANSTDGNGAIEVYRPDGTRIVDNRVLGSVVALRIYEARSAHVSGNRFLNASGEAGVVLVARPGTIEFTGNSLDGIAGVFAHGAVDLRGNWWGAASGPAGVQPGDGAAITSTSWTGAYSPWLTERPPEPAGGRPAVSTPCEPAQSAAVQARLSAGAFHAGVSARLSREVP